jgi:hypothetical protein
VDLSAVADLDRVAITTFAVDAAALRPRVGPGVEPEVFALDDGPAALVSAVSFMVNDFRFRRLPWPRFGCGHVDFRAYVHHGGQRAVWFLGAAMDSRLAAIPRRLWGMPWHRAPVVIDGHDGHYRVGGSAALMASRDNGNAPATIDGFGDLTAVADVLVNPCVGLYRRGDRIARYEVSHAPLTPEVATASHASFPAFDGLRPRLHSVLLLPPFTITIHLPPTAAGAARHPQ